MDNTESTKTMTHLVAYHFSLGPGHIGNGTRDFRLPNGFTPGAMKEIVKILSEQQGAPVMITNVMPYDQPGASNIRGHAAALARMVDRLEHVQSIMDPGGNARSAVSAILADLRVVVGEIR
jgi:hypothetical protein